MVIAWRHPPPERGARVHRRLRAPAPRHRPDRDRGVARLARLGGRRRRTRPGPLPARPAHGAGPRAGRRRAGDGHAPTTSTRSRPSRSRGSRATSTSSAASAPSSAGTRWRWSTGRTTASTASAATSRRSRRRPALYDVGFNHFFRGKDDGGFGDQIFIQGHAAPGVYARAFLEGRLTEEQLDRFRREVGGGGLPSYPHPRRMPDFWEFPTVSMGLGPLNAVVPGAVQPLPARTTRSSTPARRKVWCFVGDGEMDEPESMAGAVARGARAARQPDLRRQLQPAAPRRPGARQRQGHPGARGDLPRRRLERHQGHLGPRVGRAARPRRRRRARQQDEHAPSTASSRSTRSSRGAYIREHFFGPDPRLRQMVEHLTDDDLRKLPRGGHDYRKLYAAYKIAVEHEGSPTVILAKTVKGWTLGAELRGAQRDAPDQEADRRPSSRCSATGSTSPIPDAELEDGDPPYYHPGTDSPEYEYMMARRRALDGPLPERVVRAQAARAAAGATRTPTSSRAPARRCRRARRPRSRGCCATCSRDPEHRHARRADHPRRGAHVRPRRAVPRGEDLRAVRPALRARRRRACCCRTARRRTAASSRRGSPRPGRWRRSPPPAPRTRRGASR